MVKITLFSNTLNKLAMNVLHIRRHEIMTFYFLIYFYLFSRFILQVDECSPQVKLNIMNFNLTSTQLARNSLAEFVSKLIFIQLDFDILFSLTRPRVCLPPPTVAANFRI